MTTTEPYVEARGQCPACAKSIPFARTVSGRDKSFACKGCGRILVVSKLGLVKGALIAGIGLLVAKVFGVAGFMIALFLIGLGDWKLARTRLMHESGDA